MAVPSFRVGTKELFLPKVNVALLRTPGLPATQARFHVPLWFSKLDLRDYLWHAYGVEIVGVRAYVEQARLQQQKADAKRPTPRRWHRPPARKYMTAELLRPFVWPAEPASYAAWNQAEVEQSEEFSRKFQERAEGPGAAAIMHEERREAMREQARALLEGKVRWRPSAYRGASMGG